MWKVLLPFLLVACNTTETPETKKVSLNLKETCNKAQTLNPSGRPSLESSVMEWTDKGGTKHLDSLNMRMIDDEVWLPCKYDTQGDTAAVLHLVFTY